jgi:dTDP-4-dehydrorhamnose reductase
MHILIVGSRGQLGQAFCAIYANHQNKQVTLWQRPQQDITNPAIAYQVAQIKPDVVINCAAWVDVDRAESNVDATYAANALGPKYLADGCRRCGARLVQISTNAVFAGEPGRFYREYDQTAPRGVYAQSKLAGEIAAHHLLDRLYVVRLGWLFGPGGVNFPTKITAAADQRGQLQLVVDEFGNPTHSFDAATAIARLLETDCYGVYHMVNSGFASRFDFAEAVLQANGRAHIPLTRISASQWLRPAPTPPHAVLVNQAAAALGITLRPWQEAVNEYASQMA